MEEDRSPVRKFYKLSAVKTSMLAKVVGIIQETHDTRTFRLKVDAPFQYIPGQFIMTCLKGGVSAAGEKLPARAYSMASAPGEETVDITLNLIPNGKLTPHLFRLKDGDELDVKGPFGKFTLDESAKNIVVIAGGTGIAPFRAFWKYLIKKGHASKLTVLYSAKTKNDIIYKHEIEEIKKAGVKVVVTLTREDWDGNRGRIGAEMIKNNVPHLNDSLFYICASIEMVKSMEELLHGMGVAKEMIKKEIW